MKNISSKRAMFFFFILILSNFTVFAQERVAIEPGAGEPAFLNKEVSAYFIPQNALDPGQLAGGRGMEFIPNPAQLQVKAGEVFTQGGDYSGMTLPYLISTPRAISYPRWAIRQGWEGELVLALEILENGSVGRYRVMKSTGYKLLDETAIKSVKDWKFSPAVKGGKPLSTCIQIPVLFQLQNE